MNQKCIDLAKGVQNMKKLSLRAKMLLCILPVMAVAMILLTAVAASQSKTAIREATSARMEQSVVANVNAIEGTLDIVKNSAVNITEMVSTSYRYVTMDNYKGTLSAIVSENDSVLGAGLWFEPYTFDANEKYIGPYWYKDGSSIVETWEYSNADYDYFNQEYYLNAKSLSQGQAMITDPYYDPSSGTVMASCSAPIYDNGTFVGCVTVDMELSNIQDLVRNVQIGRTGTAMMTSSDGTYIYTTDDSKVQSAANITADDNSSLAAAGSVIMADSSTDVHETFFTEGGDTFMLLYTTIPDVNWKAMIRMNTTEMDETVNALIWQLIIICVAALLIGAVIIFVFVLNISKSIDSVKQFAGHLAAGDFTVNKINNKRGDELGQMSESLNDMYESNRDVISRISDGSVQVSETSTGLASMAVIKMCPFLFI